MNLASKMVTFEMKWLMFQGNRDGKHILLVSHLMKWLHLKTGNFFMMKYCHRRSKEASAT